ncbi:hypothetical protein TNCV_2880011 [Trichonephila clavipes]|uniref:Uncharacterized protein n=1 Tax=Trichonephila clavipes TaxID=2585209 RepID=A0A8X7BCN7_TRICX|nr:hypothetical protein TNCV_2880011 [Trichonephila clavipes]
MKNMNWEYQKSKGHESSTTRATSVVTDLGNFEPWSNDKEDIRATILQTSTKRQQEDFELYTTNLKAISSSTQRVLSGTRFRTRESTLLAIHEFTAMTLEIK